MAVRPVLDPDNPNSRALSMMRVIGRLRPDVTPRKPRRRHRARARGARPRTRGVAVFGTTGKVTVAAVPLLEAVTADVRPAILVFLVAVALLLATATANVASLQLARATTRVREIAIRSALGAGRARLARQLFVESTLLGVTGGLAGLALAWTIVRALPALLPADFPRLDAIAIDVRVVAFAIGLALVTGVLFGLIPLLQARRLDLVAALAEDGLAPVGGGTRSRTARVRAVIMAGQVAITCVLLVGAALLGRSFVALLHADRGYDPANVLTARLIMPTPPTRRPAARRCSTPCWRASTDTRAPGRRPSRACCRSVAARRSWGSPCRRAAGPRARSRCTRRSGWSAPATSTRCASACSPAGISPTPTPARRSRS